MPFLTQGKTNWKYILIVLILAAIIGGGILYYYQYWQIKVPESPQFKCNTCKAEFISWCENCRSLGWPTRIEGSPHLSTDTLSCMKKCFDITLPKTNYCFDKQNLCKDFGVLVEEVVVTTDDKEYKQNEPIEIKVSNLKSTAIFYEICEKGPFSLEEYVDETWQKFPKYVFPATECESTPESLAELKPRESFTENGLEIERLHLGKYRIKFTYYLKREISTPKFSYSNEFTIKEKGN